MVKIGDEQHRAQDVEPHQEVADSSRDVKNCFGSILTPSYKQITRL